MDFVVASKCLPCPRVCVCVHTLLYAPTGFPRRLIGTSDVCLQTLPAACEVVPSMVLVFQLIAPVGHGGHVCSSGLAWGAFPACGPNLCHIQGRCVKVHYTHIRCRNNNHKNVKRVSHCFVNAGQAIYTVIDNFCNYKVTLIYDVNNKQVGTNIKCSFNKLFFLIFQGLKPLWSEGSQAHVWTNLGK